MLSIFILIFILDKKVNNIKVRKLLVTAYIFFYGIGTLEILISIGIAIGWSLKKMYSFVYRMSIVCSGNQTFAVYITISFALVFSVPLIKVLLKLVKRHQYNSDKKGNGTFSNMDDSGRIQSLMYVMSNTIIAVVNKIPYLGIIHIINLVLVIVSNVMNIFEASINVKNTEIYMAVILSLQIFIIATKATIPTR